MDAQLLKDNFAQVAGHGIDVAEYFYSDLFRRNPSYRSLFPASMAQQQQLLLEALSHIVSLVDNPPELVPYVQELGLRHDGFGVTEGHYEQVGVSLLSTLRYFSGDDWNDVLEKNWGEAYGLVARVMAEATAQRS